MHRLTLSLLFFFLLILISSCTRNPKFERIKLLAEKGDAAAQCDLADMFRQGIGTEKDYQKAVIWYNKSAEQGYDRAQYILAGMYFFGSGVLTDKKESLYWYTKSAKHGNASAQCRAGMMYLYGEGTHVDEEQAKHWLTEGAKNGGYDKVFIELHSIQDALDILNSTYDSYETIAINRKELIWMSIFAQYGVAKVQYSLAKKYYDGDGVKRDRSLAAFWMRKAYKNGYMEAKEEWDSLELWKYEN